MSSSPSVTVFWALVAPWRLWITHRQPAQQSVVWLHVSLNAFSIEKCVVVQNDCVFMVEIINIIIATEHHSRAYFFFSFFLVFSFPVWTNSGSAWCHLLLFVCSSTRFVDRVRLYIIDVADNDIVFCFHRWNCILYLVLRPLFRLSAPKQHPFKDNR